MISQRISGGNRKMGAVYLFKLRRKREARPRRMSTSCAIEAAYSAEYGAPESMTLAISLSRCSPAFWSHSNEVLEAHMQVAAVEVEFEVTKREAETMVVGKVKGRNALRAHRDLPETKKGRQQRIGAGRSAWR